MQPRDIAAVRHRAEHTAFIGIGVLQQVQGLVRMGRDDDLVEMRDLARGIRDRDFAGRAPDAPHGRTGTQGGRGGGEQTGDVLAAAADDRAPLRPITQAEQAVVLEETNESRRRVGRDIAA